MHKLAAIPGGWNPNTEGVIFIEQTPAPIVFLTAADTDIQTIAAAIPKLDHDFPHLRVANLLNLQQQLSIDTYAEKVLFKARIIILRLLGGNTYWSYGLEAIKEVVNITGAALFVLPGDDVPDPDLISHSTVPLTLVDRVWRYFIAGGVENYLNALKFISNACLPTNYQVSPPQSIPDFGLYSWQNLNNLKSQNSQDISSVGLLFYRSHYLAGNLLPIDALCQSLEEKNLEPVPIFISSLRKPDLQTELLTLVREKSIKLLLNTTSFSVAKIEDEAAIAFWEQLNIPVLQVILSSSSQEQWEASFQGLMPRDVAMNVALPEVDGRIITRAVSFKSVQTWNEQLETNVIAYQPQSDRIDFVAQLTANWVNLAQTPAAERKIALILANYPNKDGRIANGVGLDTPASCIEILQALQQEGYYLPDIPETGDELIQLLTAGVTNDLESSSLRVVQKYLETAEYQQYFQTLPTSIRQAIIARWGEVDAGMQEGIIPIPGIELGNVFIGIQPSRGYDRDPSLNYHAPDLEPTHEYLAYYYWLRKKFQVGAIVHVGKHGNLEWLPGKSIALSGDCYPEIALQAIPNIYPFIVNDPGEGSQAKRRSSAVIIDHLTPPLTRAELYGGLEKLEALIDEYYEAQSLDPTRLPIISDRITQLVETEQLNRDLGIEEINPQSLTQFLTIADGYLCELKEAQIRDGLHILGKCPQGNQLRDLIIAIARSPSLNRLGLTQAIVKDLGLDFDPLLVEGSYQLSVISRGGSRTARTVISYQLSGENWQNKCLAKLKTAKNSGDAIAIIESIAIELVESICQGESPLTPLNKRGSRGELTHTQKQLNWIQNSLLPNLQQCDREITNLIAALDGKYVPSGASGAPTRGRPEVLPTGRNFYSVDIRSIPTETAWDVGRKAAEAVIERYTQENGEYPQTLAISIWGTSTMRTGGDDIAQVMALMGVQPVWDGLSRRVVDFEILPASVLNRPRVDVTVRVSGFFRDSFPNILSLFNNITQAIAQLPESAAINPLAERVEKETEFWQQQGITADEAGKRATYRLFGSKPGAYGAGLQGLIESQNWQTDEDLARAYLNWSSYAYDSNGKGNAAPESFQQRLQQLQIVLHNQDNREHDLLDSDDYYQFQGGLTAAVRSLTGNNPTVYFGDNSRPSNPKVRKLSEEIARVYRSRVINPKWIQGVMRHGYKGAFEMAATVDYLFAYDATTRCVPDHMYEGVAQAYILNDQVQQFVRDKNPWALRDMAERLLEAHQRKMWHDATEQTIETLKEIANHAEGAIEMRD
ncbi:MAG: cobaltochelatase subunit CobN [Pleurocapsa sp.]